MKKTQTNLLLLTAILMGSVPALCQAADNACLIEGSTITAGKVNPIKDCLENNGVAPEQFKSTCDTIVKTGEAMAKIMGGPAPKMTYMGSCPALPEGACEGFMGQPMTSYYYKRGADIGKTRESCLRQGGRWK